MSISDSSARARQLGSELRRERERFGVSLRELATQLGWSTSKVSRMEAGRRGTLSADVAIYLARCGTSRQDRERLVRLAEDSEAAFRLQDHGERLPDELRSLIELETTADAIIGYDPLAVPGLLQTEPYVRALLGWGRQRRDEAFELRVRARLARQVVFQRRWPPLLRFFVHEHALRANIGGDRVMNDQLLHLVFTSSLPRVEIRVLEAATTPLAIFGSGFYLMEYPGYRPLVYAQTRTASLFLEEEAEVQTHRATLAELAACALDGRQSREWLAAVASEYDRAEDDPHDEPGAGADLA